MQHCCRINFAQNTNFGTIASLFLLMLLIEKNSYPLRGLVVRVFAGEAWYTEFDVGRTKDIKNGVCCFFCFNAQHLRVTQRIKKQSVDYTAVKEKLIQSRRYKTLAIIKR